MDIKVSDSMPEEFIQEDHQTPSTSEGLRLPVTDPEEHQLSEASSSDGLRLPVVVTIPDMEENDNSSTTEPNNTALDANQVVLDDDDPSQATTVIIEPLGGGVTNPKEDQHAQTSSEKITPGRGRPRKSDTPKKLDEVQQSNIETDFMLVTPSLKRGRGRPPNPFKVQRPPSEHAKVGRPRIHPPKEPSGRGRGRPRIHPPKEKSGRRPGRPPSLSTSSIKRYAKPFNLSKSLEIRLVKCTVRDNKKRGRPPGAKNKPKEGNRPRGRPPKADSENSLSKESLSYQDFVRQVDAELLAINGSLPSEKPAEKDYKEQLDESGDEQDTSAEIDSLESDEDYSPNRSPGRPAGSKNNYGNSISSPRSRSLTSSGKKRGRPFGAKSRPKEERNDNSLATSSVKRKPGRPPGAKNKSKSNMFIQSNHSFLSGQELSDQEEIDVQTSPTTKKRGRPPGAKNKSKDILGMDKSDIEYDKSISDIEFIDSDDEGQSSSQVKKGRGRPPGAKNKPKDDEYTYDQMMSDLENYKAAMGISDIEVSDGEGNIITSSPTKKRRGRPPGAKNKSKGDDFTHIVDRLEEENNRSASNNIESSDNENANFSSPKKGRGRPPGAKNRSKGGNSVERSDKDFEESVKNAINFDESDEDENEHFNSPTKRRPGRPPKRLNESNASDINEADKSFSSLVEKRQRGRPPGAKNKDRSLVDSLTVSPFWKRKSKKTEDSNKQSDNSWETFDESDVQEHSDSSPIKRKPGRPPGAKNKFNKDDIDNDSHQTSNDQSKRKPGRPPGAKNRPKPDDSLESCINTDIHVTDKGQSSEKRKPGRPPGAKNRPKPEDSWVTATDTDNSFADDEKLSEKRKPGRPPGAKNKPKSVDSLLNATDTDVTEEDHISEKRKPGRPPGAKYKSQLNDSQDISTDNDMNDHDNLYSSSSEKRKPGRPNKTKLDMSTANFADSEDTEDESIISAASPSKRRGRPPGAKNKPKDESPKIKVISTFPSGKKRGRPFGTGKKDKQLVTSDLTEEGKPRGCKGDVSYTEAVEEIIEEEFSDSGCEEEEEVMVVGNEEAGSSGKRRRGRPVGSVNKKHKSETSPGKPGRPRIAEEGKRIKNQIDYAALASGDNFILVSDDESDSGSDNEEENNVSMTDQSDPKRQPGRPPKSEQKRRGRPPKSRVEDKTDDSQTEDYSTDPGVKRGPGRPKKSKLDVNISSDETSLSNGLKKKGRGRPKKVDPILDMTCEEEETYDPTGISSITMEGWERFEFQGKSSGNTFNVAATVHVCNGTELPTSSNRINNKGPLSNEKPTESPAAVTYMDDITMVNSNSPEKTSGKSKEKEAHDNSLNERVQFQDLCKKNMNSVLVDGSSSTQAINNASGLVTNEMNNVIQTANQTVTNSESSSDSSYVVNVSSTLPPNAIITSPCSTVTTTQSGSSCPIQNMVKGSSAENEVAESIQQNTEAGQAAVVKMTA